MGYHTKEPSRKNSHTGKGGLNVMRTGDAGNTPAPKGIQTPYFNESMTKTLPSRGTTGAQAQPSKAGKNGY